MTPFILTKIDFGHLGVEYSDTHGESRKEIAANFANGEYDQFDPTSKGLLQVIEVNADNTWTDITADICKLAEHYLNSNLLNCDGCRLRLLTEHQIVEPWVASIVEGEWKAAERDPDYLLEDLVERRRLIAAE